MVGGGWPRGPGGAEPGGRSGGDSRVCRRHRAERGQEAVCDGGPGVKCRGGDRGCGVGGGNVDGGRITGRRAKRRDSDVQAPKLGGAGDPDAPPSTQRQPCAHLASPAPTPPGLGPERPRPAGFSVQSGPFVLASSAHPRVGPANPLSPL